MYWILASLFVLIALAVPKLRPIGVVGCLVMGALLGWGMLQRLRGADPATQQMRGQPTAPAVVRAPMALESVQLADLVLSGSGAPFTFRGRVRNQAQEMILRSVTIDIVRLDCYEGALDPSGCVHLWSARQWVDVSVPPGEQREFATSIWARGSAPRGRGTPRDRFTLISASGSPL